MGIAVQAAAAPTQLLLSLRGSGQALYVGMAEDAFVVASEPYGLVEETSTYLRIDGETPADPSPGVRDPRPGRHARRRSTRERWRASSGSRSTARLCRSSDDELQRAEITTRDIDRGDFPHYLLKEMSEAPASFRKTLRGKVVADADGLLHVVLGTRHAARHRCSSACAPVRSDESP